MNGYAVVLDGVRTDFGATPFSIAGLCACTAPLAISGGRHTVVVVAYNASGESASPPFVIEPAANAGGPYAGQVGLNVTVDAEASVAPTGSLVRYIWRWGDGTPDTIAATADAAHTYLTGGTFPITLTITDNAGATAVATTSVTVLAPAALPWPWNTSDIGNVGRPGEVSYVPGGAFGVNAAGADIWDDADSFRYVFQPLAGNGRIIARVTGLGNTNAFAKAGVMLRESLDADAAHALLDVKPDGGIEFLTRASAGMPTSYVAGGTQTPPSWLALTRSGNTMTASASADGLSWWTVGTIAMTTPTAWVGLAVTSHDEAALTNATFDAVSVSPGVTVPPGSTTSTPPPAGNEGGAVPTLWQHRDVGLTGRTGAATFAPSGAFVVSGAGADIWDTSDAFHYVYQPLAGDGDLIARVASLQDTNPFAKAGLMIRAGLAPDAAHVILDVRPTGDVEFMTRPGAGDVTRFIAPAILPAPAWLRLTRTGSIVTGFVSRDGSTWIPVGTTIVSFDPTQDVLAGLAVTSHDPNTLNTAIFDSVAVSAAPVSLSSSSTRFPEGAERRHDRSSAKGAESRPGSVRYD